MTVKCHPALPALAFIEAAKEADIYIEAAERTVSTGMPGKKRQRNTMRSG
ncbi:hypothetical protein [Phyllobacterium sp. YR531]|nr:hypothetical protein [Phyllobacterium sp. YR531]